MPSRDTKVEMKEDATSAGRPPRPEPEFHLTIVDSTLPPVSLLRQIVQGFREPKITNPSKYYQATGTEDTTQAGGPGPDSSTPPSWIPPSHQFLFSGRSCKGSASRRSLIRASITKRRALGTLRKREVPGLSSTPPSWSPPSHPFPFSGRSCKGSASRRSPIRVSITKRRAPRTLHGREVRLCLGLSTTPPSWIPPFHRFRFSGRFSANRGSEFRRNITA